MIPKVVALNTRWERYATVARYGALALKISSDEATRLSDK
jgi:hypothetical protein